MANKVNAPERITISGTNWVILNTMRKPRESFDDVINRLLAERERLLADNRAAVLHDPD